jgi:hypothetical protein
MTSFNLAISRLRALKSVANDADYLGQATRWSPREWIRTEPMRYRGKRKKSDLDGLVRHQDFFRGRPEAPITRKSLLDAVLAAGDDDLRLEEAFVLTMAWGFRPKSYGPYRTSVMLSGAKGGRPTAALLAELRKVLTDKSDDSDPVMHAYSAMAGQLELCGPAFGTKWLYVASPESNRAPILDAVVAEWLERHEVYAGSRPISASAWSSKDYRRYLDFCRQAASDIGCDDAGFVEYLMFTDQQYFEYSSRDDSFPEWIRRASR